MMGSQHSSSGSDAAGRAIRSEEFKFLKTKFLQLPSLPLCACQVKSAEPFFSLSLICILFPSQRILQKQRSKNKQTNKNPIRLFALLFAWPSTNPY